ncbi:MAG TPA: hypothetical protein VJP85_01140 [Candidatus Baltobacteraceae bacterium]|nr:hypothetical protein [Candidatus Baltobacteraceae bacterium]
MGVSAPAAAKANGLSTVVNVVTAPREAFETLRVVPMWGWAFVVAAALATLGQYLATPATIHALQSSWPAQVAANPRLAALTPEQQQHALDVTLGAMHYGWLIAPVSVLVVALLQAVIMLVFRTAGKGDATFKQLWCASMNVAVIGAGMYSLLAGLIAVVRGPASYNSILDALRAVPSLAWLAQGAPVKIVAFLGAFNVVSVWGAIVLAIAMVWVAKVSKANAASCAVVTTVLAGLYFFFTAR